jgi:hypothetical protein
MNFTVPQVREISKSFFTTQRSKNDATEVTAPIERFPCKEKGGRSLL